MPFDNAMYNISNKNNFFFKGFYCVTEDEIIPKVKKIIFHDPATIVFWEDGTKTVVKRMKDQEFSKYYGFLAALGKKLYKNNSHLQRMIEQYGVEED